MSCKAQQTNGSSSDVISITSKLIGAWVSEDDANWTIEFTTDGKCYWHYTNDDTDTHDFSVSTSSPQCGYDVRTNVTEDFYLRLIDQSDASESCYEILGVNEDSLSLSTISLTVKNYLFNKQ